MSMGGGFPKLGKLLGHEEEHAEVLSATSGSCMEIEKKIRLGLHFQTRSSGEQQEGKVLSFSLLILWHLQDTL